MISTNTELFAWFHASSTSTDAGLGRYVFNNNSFVSAVIVHTHTTFGERRVNGSYQIHDLLLGRLVCPCKSTFILVVV